MSRLLALAAAVLTASCAILQGEPIGRERIAELLASPDRTEADRKNDLRRKPADMLAFIGVRPGIIALDVAAGGGYTTELIARAAGPAGKVYGQSPRDAARVIARANNVRTIAGIVRPFEDPAPPEVASNSLDLVTLMFNYHDFGHLGVDRARANRAVFNALKSGGIFVVADHSGRPGTGISESKTLHRIEESFLRAEVEAAGFRFLESGNFLRNPNDPRDQETPPMPKDEFVLKFVKP